MSVKSSIIVLFFIVIFNTVSSQKQFVSSGGNISGSAGSVSFSLGQVTDSYFSNASFSINEGVQQPFITSLLPVTLIDFQAELKSNTVVLNWNTNTEINSLKFIIEKSGDGIQFSTTNETPAAGYSYSIKRYSSIDLFPFLGTNYYRLKQVDKDGKFSYSKVAIVNYKNKQIASIFPNPTNDVVNLVLNTLPEKISYILTDENGKVLQKNNIVNRQTKIDIIKFPSAIYFIQLILNNKEIQTLQITKTK